MKRHHKITVLCSWLFGLFLVGYGHAQNCTEGNTFIDPAFTCDRWTVEDGLPVNTINDIIQSKNGYIWIGTNDGLVRFDGVRFKVYKSAKYAGLPSNRISKLIEAPDESIWLFTAQQQLVKFQGEKFEYITREKGLNGERVNHFYTDQKGKLWIGTDSGISVYKDGEISSFYPGVIKGSISQIYSEGEEILWYKDDSRLSIYRFENGTASLMTAEVETTDPVPFLNLQDGSILFATMGHIFRHKNGELTEEVPGLPPDFLTTDIYQHTDGSILIISLKQGIFEISNGRLQKFYSGFEGRRRASFWQAPDSLWVLGNLEVLLNANSVFSFDDQIVDFIHDREGSLWLGSASRGLFRLKPNLFRIYSEPEGLPNGNIYPVHETLSGAIWFGTHGDGPVRLQNARITADFPFIPQPENQYVRSVLERANGELLVSLLGEGIYRLNKQKEIFEAFPAPEPHISLGKIFTINALFEDSRKQLWAGSNYGIFIYDENKWEQVGGEYSRVYPVRYFAEAPDGSIWMAANGDGIYRHKNGKFSRFTATEGLSSNLIRSVFIDTSGSASPGDYILWISTEDKGLNRLEVTNGNPDFSGITIYNEESGLYDNAVHQVLVDDYDRFWMSGNKGISWVSRNNLEQFSRGEISRINATSYTEQDGLRNREANGGVQSAGIKTGDGRIWFPTQDGLVVINPDEISQNEIPPPVVIEEVTHGNQVIPPQENTVTLQPEQRNFEIAYTGLSFLVPDKVKFQYRLTGFDEKWTDAGNRRQAFYTNVPPGTYIFEVMAANNNEIWSEDTATLRVVVKPYFYETGFFYFLLFGVIGIGLAGAIYVRIRHLQKRQEVLEDSVKERTFELEVEKKKTERQAKELLKLDKVKSQFFTNITHEFRTPLTLIIGPLQRLQKKHGDFSPEEAHPEIERVLRSSYRLQRLIDQILDVSKLEAGELKLNIQKIEVVAFIKTLLDLFEPLSLEQGQQLQFSTTAKELFLYVDADALEKILANLVSNAIKFTPEGGAITIQVEETENECVIRVKDTGVGIPPEKTEHIFNRFYQADDSSTREAEGSGIGLALVKNLVELHEGKIDVHSELGKGSTFTLHFKKKKIHLSEEQTQPGHPEKTDLNHLKTKVYSGYVPDRFANEEEPRGDVPTVLVAEDNADMRDFVSSILKESFSVITAKDGKEALEMVKEWLPDLIVADVMMPNMDGMQLNKALKKNPMLESIPVIFLTAKTETDSKLKGFEEDADDYITKPFDAELLAARVDNIIRKRKKLRDYYLGNRTVAESKDTQNPFLKELSDIIEEHFANPDFGIQELSEKIHLDRTHLYRKIKENFSQSPQQFLSDFRMKKAAHMLQAGEGNISEIAYASGFNSLAYFSKVFKKYHKVSPSDYKRIKLDQNEV